jgi:hypothetical protein
VGKSWFSPKHAVLEVAVNARYFIEYMVGFQPDSTTAALYSFLG